MEALPCGVRGPRGRWRRGGGSGGGGGGCATVEEEEQVAVWPCDPVSSFHSLGGPMCSPTVLLCFAYAIIFPPTYMYIRREILAAELPFLYAKCHRQG